MLGEDDLEAFSARNLHPEGGGRGELPSLTHFNFDHTDKTELKKDLITDAWPGSIDLIH